MLKKWAFSLFKPLILFVFIFLLLKNVAMILPLKFYAVKIIVLEIISLLLVKLW